MLFGDVAGYSRLAGEDEDATHRRLSQYLDLISTTMEHHRGRAIHYAGDALLAMFEAVVDGCPVRPLSKDPGAPERRSTRAAQDPLSDQRQSRRRPRGPGDICGDGVNVAARLKSLAEPGGSCFSEAVHASVGSKPPGVGHLYRSFPPASGVMVRPQRGADALQRFFESGMTIG